MAEGSNGTANGTTTVERTVPLKLKRPKRIGSRLITGRGITTYGKPFSLSTGTIMPPPDYEMDWKHENLDTNTLTTVSPTRLLEILANLSPEMSKGVWDYMRLLNPGWSFEVFSPGGETPNARGRAIVEEILDRIKQQHGSVDVVLGRLHMGAYMRGGYFGEAVFDDVGREMIDIATPDPASVRFKVVEDQETKKQRWQLGQWQDYKFVPLDEEEGVSYIPVDPYPGSPYGRPLVAPAMFSALFLLGLLHDLRRVISQQGWPRIHIKVLVDKLLAGLEQDENVQTSEQVEKALQAAIDDVKTEYARLQPDDAYITGDDVEIGGPIGVTGSTNLSGIEGVIEVVERMLVRALKTMPLVLGITDGVSEANANRQWEILVAGVKALQHLAESMLERFFELACRMQGVQVNVVWEFSEIRASERQRDALSYSQEIDNQYKLLDKGMIDRDEVAMELVGHPPYKSEEEMKAEALEIAGQTEDDPDTDVQDSDENPEPGTANAVQDWLQRQAGRTFTPAQHTLRPERMRHRDAYILAMVDAGQVYVGARKIPHGARSDDFSWPGERLVLAGTWQVGGRAAADEYDVFVMGGPDGSGACTVPAETGRHTVERGTVDRTGDDERRGAGDGAVRSGRPRLRRPAGRYPRLTTRSRRRV